MGKFEVLVARVGRIATTLVLATLVGCASTPREFDGLTEASGHVVFILDEGVQITTGSEPIYLARGGYRLIKQNSAGSMYAAPEFGVIRRTSRGYMGYLGGVWIPRDPRGNAKVFVLYETSERLYTDLSSALETPAEVEGKVLEQAKRDEGGPAPRLSIEEPGFVYRNPAYSPAAMLITALLDTQKGKPDVLAEIPRIEMEGKLGPAVPARSPTRLPTTR